MAKRWCDVALHTTLVAYARDHATEWQQRRLSTIMGQEALWEVTLGDCQSEAEVHALMISKAWQSLGVPCIVCSDGSATTRPWMSAIRGTKGIGVGWASVLDLLAVDAWDSKWMSDRESWAKVPDLGALDTDGLLSCGAIDDLGHLYEAGPKYRIYEYPASSASSACSSSSSSSSSCVPPSSVPAALATGPASLSATPPSESVPERIYVGHAAHRPRAELPGIPGILDDSWRVILGKPALLVGSLVVANLRRLIPRFAKIVHFMVAVSTALPGCQAVACGFALPYCATSLPWLRWKLRPGSPLWKELWRGETPPDVVLHIVAPDKAPGTDMKNSLLSRLQDQLTALAEGRPIVVTNKYIVVSQDAKKQSPRVFIHCLSSPRLADLMDTEGGVNNLAMDSAGRFWTTSRGWESLETGLITVKSSQLHQIPRRTLSLWLFTGMGVRVLWPKWSNEEMIRAVRSLFTFLFSESWVHTAMINNPRPGMWDCSSNASTSLQLTPSILHRALATAVDPELWLAIWDCCTRTVSPSPSKTRDVTGGTYRFHVPTSFLLVWPRFSEGACVPGDTFSVSAALTRLWSCVQPTRAQESWVKPGAKSRPWIAEWAVPWVCAFLEPGDRVRLARTGHCLYITVTCSSCWRADYMKRYQPLRPWCAKASHFLGARDHEPDVAMALTALDLGDATSEVGSPVLAASPRAQEATSASTQGRQWFHLYWQMHTVPRVTGDLLCTATVTHVEDSEPIPSSDPRWTRDLRALAMDYVYFRYDDHLFVIGKTAEVHQWMPDHCLWVPVCLATYPADEEALESQAPTPQPGDSSESKAPRSTGSHSIPPRDSDPKVVRVRVPSTWGLLSVSWHVAKRRLLGCRVPTRSGDAKTQRSLHGIHGVHWDQKTTLTSAPLAQPTAREPPSGAWTLGAAQDSEVLGVQYKVYGHGTLGGDDLPTVCAVQVGPLLLSVRTNGEHYAVQVRDTRTGHCYNPGYTALVPGMVAWLQAHALEMYAVIQGGAILLLPRTGPKAFPQCLGRLHLASLALL